MAKAYTRDDLRQIAYYQKLLLRWVLAYLVGLVVLTVTHPILEAIGNEVLQGIVSTPIIIFMVLTPFAWGFCVLNMALRLEGKGGGCVLFVLSGVPVLGLILVLGLNDKATKVLRKHGFQVGLMGVRMSEFDRRPETPDSTPADDRDAT